MLPSADFKHAPSTPDEFDGGTSGNELVPRTEGMWLVASHHAVFDLDNQGGDSCVSRWSANVQHPAIQSSYSGAAEHGGIIHQDL